MRTTTPSIADAKNRLGGIIAAVKDHVTA